jgi:hypothetical protein
MLEPKKPGEDDDTGDATLRKETTKQVDSQDMSLPEDEGGAEPQQPSS